MFKAVSRVLVIAMMLVAFVGQAITFNISVSCETSVAAPFSNVTERVKHYGASLIDPDSPTAIDSPTDIDSPVDTNNSEDCCGIECCDLDCTCIANACSSFVYVNSDVNSTKTVASSDVAYVQQSEQPKSIATLLYRPPIITS